MIAHLASTIFFWGVFGISIYAIFHTLEEK